MTSEHSECYVYITLPNTITPVTAGKFVLTKNKSGIPLGRFIYGKKYLSNENAVQIDPIELKLTEKQYETTKLRGVFGALRDASPDYWGRRVIDRHSNKSNLSELDYLLYSPDDRAGALGFGLNKEPPAPKKNFNKTIDLMRLQEAAYAIIKDEDHQVNSITEQVADILLLGTSMGGARPKAVVEDSEGLWIAKFNRDDDSWDQAKIEHTMLKLANKCGLNVAKSRVETIGNKNVLLVKRFDREKTQNGYQKSRMISALTLLNTEDTHQSRDKWSYIVLAEELRKISKNPRKDACELFKRMCFNALISNTDDHPRNHAVIALNEHWGLSPAYDLTPFTPISIERRDLAMTCGDYGRYANYENILTQCQRFLLDKDEAQAIVDNMIAIIKEQWYSLAKSCGVSELDCKRISSAFVYDGFYGNKPHS